MNNERLLREFYQGSMKALSRLLSQVENDPAGSLDLLSGLESDRGAREAAGPALVTGITGPPGSGKSTLINAMVSHLIEEGQRVAVLAVDPSSPFHGGALLGDRIRLQPHFSHPGVFIRSLSSRGALGGLSAACVEMVDVLQAFGFDHILVETVGVGQSEVEIASLADTTILVLVPEAGDDIQAVKSGLMEIADIFVVNKSDRDGARELTIVLQRMLHERPANDWNIPVLQAVATKNEHIGEIIAQIRLHHQTLSGTKKAALIAGRAWHLIVRKRMQDVNRERLTEQLSSLMGDPSFNLYRFVKEYRKRKTR